MKKSADHYAQFITGNGFTVNVKRSHRRRTMALAIKAGQVNIHLPATASMTLAKQFVARKSGWIQQQLSRYPAPSERSVIDGSRQWWLGQKLPLVWQSDTSHRGEIICTDGQLQLSFHHRQLADVIIALKLLREFYASQAKMILPDRCYRIANQIDLQPETVSVRFFSARWGSCRKDGLIQLNALLIQAPPEIVDYVIIHELCHLREMNHSAAFWQLVASFCPDYVRHKTWLKENGPFLSL